MTHALIAEGITARLGARQVLHGVDVTARAGQVTTIIGPNGSGKTTLLRRLTGDLPGGGTVRLNGQDIAGLRPHDLAALRAVLPQAGAMAFPFTVLEVVSIGLHRGLAAGDPAIPLAALARVGMTRHAHSRFQDLSGGEQQRVHLARVLAQVWQPVGAGGAPRWLFLDEPVSALDIAHQLQVMQVARDFACAGGGVVAVLHDLNLTALFADQMVVLADGACIAAGPPRRVMTDAVLSRAYGCALRVGHQPDGTPYLLPHLAALTG